MRNDGGGANVTPFSWMPEGSVQLKGWTDNAVTTATTDKAIKIDPTKHLQMKRLMAEALGFNLKLVEVNIAKPWGGYLRLTHDSLTNFLAAYWKGVGEFSVGDLSVDPKVLLVAPGKMLSLQWHKRRSEQWRVIDGPVRIVMGNDWNSLKHSKYLTGEVLRIPPAQWHRLIGLSGWGRVAEIWQHTDSRRPSDEEDVLRVQDKYRRADPEADPSMPVEKRDAKWGEFEKTHT